jgi:imidazoleglycerol-phosphate dehydratase/histidinol-phosphatase
MMLNTLKGEGVVFDRIHIDRSFPEDNSPARKPGTAMLNEYMKGRYDLQNSYVIGDRLTDVMLARNLGCKAIWFNQKTNESELKKEKLQDSVELISTDWAQIARFVIQKPRRAKIVRKTKETDIRIELNLDGSGQCKIDTGLKFFDHMLEQIGRHSGSDLSISVSGDLEVDEHHTIEDTALALGEALRTALDDKRGIMRYGFLLPMDDCRAQVAIDLSGRPWLVWEVEFKREKVGDVPTEMFMHFFKSLSDAAACNLHITATGDNEHHKAEAIFKALARSIKQAKGKDPDSNELPSTKGSL